MRIIEQNPLPGSNAKLAGYLHEPDDEFIHGHDRPCVIVCPGGAYRRLASHEAEPVAMRFYTAGYQAFVLSYTVYNTKSSHAAPLGMGPLMELSAAVRLIRRDCRELHVAPGRVYVCGFSAGGHLAASLGVLWECEALNAAGPSNRPDAMILCYPVITAGEFAHQESINHLVGKSGDRAFYGLEHHVSTTAPPAFLWHTASDASVPLENTLLFVCALRKHGVPLECHLYGSGAHGLGLCEEEGKVHPHCGTWFSLCLEWLRMLPGHTMTPSPSPL